MDVLSSVEKNINEWKGRERRFEQLFGSEILKNKQFLKEKLANFEGLYLDLRSDNSKDARMMLVGINAERRKVERQLYPGLLNRLLVRAVKTVVLKRLSKKKTVESQTNLDRLRSEMDKVGLSPYFDLAKSKMKQGENEMVIPVSFHQNENERIDLLMKFSKDEHNGFELKTFKIAVTSALNGKKTLQQNFTPEQHINLNQGINLLAGRAIADQNSWRQLDFTDREADGNFRFKVFPKDLGFGIVKALENLPFLPHQNQRVSIAERLENGEKVPVTLLINGKEKDVLLVANPQKGNVLLLNSEGSEIKLGHSQPQVHRAMEKGPTEELKKRRELKVHRNGTGI